MEKRPAVEELKQNVASLSVNIAEGILEAVAEVGVEVPVVVRLAGNRSKEGAEKLAASKLNVVAAEGFSEAAQKIVEMVAK